MGCFCFAASEDCNVQLPGNIMASLPNWQTSSHTGCTLCDTCDRVHAETDEAFTNFQLPRSWLIEREAKDLMPQGCHKAIIDALEWSQMYPAVIACQSACARSSESSKSRHPGHTSPTVLQWRYPLHITSPVIYKDCAAQSVSHVQSNS